jgi:hypothetical protein
MNILLLSHEVVSLKVLSSEIDLAEIIGSFKRPILKRERSEEVFRKSACPVELPTPE